MKTREQIVTARNMFKLVLTGEVTIDPPPCEEVRLNMAGFINACDWITDVQECEKLDFLLQAVAAKAAALAEQMTVQE